MAPHPIPTAGFLSVQGGASMYAGTITIKRRERLVIARYWGVLTREDVRREWQEIRKQPEFDPSFSLLCDLSAITEVKIGFDEQYLLASERDPFNQSSLRVFVAPDDLVYAAIRSFERLSYPEKTVRVVRTLPDAWELLSITPTS